MLLQTSQALALETSATLSRYYMPDAILPVNVARTLNAAKVPFILVGAHASFCWMHEPRATKDVDIVVAAKHHQRAVKVLLRKFRTLEEIDLPVVTRLRNRETQVVAIDVIKSHDLYRAAFRHTHAVKWENVSFRIPNLEMALAMKFAPMVSPNRDGAKKLIDAHDFIMMVRANPDIDLDLLAELGELVYRGGGEEALELVRRVRTGETLIL